MANYVIATGVTTNGKIVTMQNGALTTNVAINRTEYNKDTRSFEDVVQWVTVIFSASSREKAEKLLTAGENAVKNLNLMGNLTASVLKYQDGSEHEALTLWVDSPSGINYAYAGGRGLCQVTLQGCLGNDTKNISEKSVAISIAESIGYGDNEKTQWYNILATGDIKAQIERMKLKKGNHVDITFELDGVEIYNGKVTIKGQAKNLVFSAQRAKREEAPQPNASQPQNAIAQPAYAAPVQSAPVPQPTAYVAPAQPAPQYQAAVQPQQPVYTAPVQSVPVPQPAPVPQTPADVASGFMPDDDALNALIASANGQFAM